MTAGQAGMTPPARGVRLGVDVGSVRVGVASCDPDGILATPVATLDRDGEQDTDIAQVAAWVNERDVVEVAIGLPKTLRGHSGQAVAAAQDYADRLGRRIEPVPIVFVDERLSSVEANRVLYERRVPGKSRKSVVDQLAAVTILQTRLDALRAAGGGHGRR